MKRKLLAVALIIICISVVAGGSLAFFSKSETAHNVITTGSIDIALLEWADEDKKIPFPAEGTEGVLPGHEITKIVEVKNTHQTNEAFVRVKVEKAIALAEGVTLERADLSLLEIDFNTTDWTLKDDYYYYNSVLMPGDITTPLFESVKFATAMGNDYQYSTATVTVTAQAVQVKNNGTAETTALTANGWPQE